MVTWTKPDLRVLDQEALAVHIKRLTFRDWKPSLIVMHNTWAPTLEQLDDITGWMKPGTMAQRLKNWENYYKVEQKWSAGPHAFLSEEIGLFTPFNRPGVHSPSFNGKAIGIEMVGNYDKETMVGGRGLQVFKNAVCMVGLLCAKLGLDPDVAIKLHKDDPKTSHKDCPGKNFSRAGFIQAVNEWMGSGGEHLADVPPAKPPKYKATVVGVAKGDSLNIRAAASAGSKKIGELAPGASVTISNEAMNGETRWLYVDGKGWVNGRYIE